MHTTAARRYVHYGSATFDPARFDAPRNVRGFGKPSGGLWASPEDAALGWRRWCEREGFFVGRLAEGFSFSLAGGSRVLGISCEDDLDGLPRQAVAREAGRDESFDPDYLRRHWGMALLDFETLAGEYDAIEALVEGDAGLHRALYGWDVDTLLVLRPGAVAYVRAI